MGRKHMTKEQREEAARRYLDNEKVTVIAASFSVHRTIIQRLMRRMGLPRRPRGRLKPQEVAKAVQ